ncbi:MAG: glycosyltransferase family 2 protein [Actinomycetota bacterium]
MMEQDARPQVTIVIPTHDRPHLVDRAVRSALAQDEQDIEVIVVDDGSTPPYRPSVSDERLRVLRHDESKGGNAARNLGLAHARGEWITFLDDDDELLPHMVRTSLETAARSTLPPPVSVLTAIEVVDEAGTVVNVRRPVTMPKGRHYSLERAPEGRTFLTQNTLLVRVDVIRAIGGWDEKIRTWDHDDLFLRLNPVSSLVGADVTTYRMHTHTGPRVHEDTLRSALSIERTLRKHRDTFRRYRRRRAKMTASAGMYYLRAGRWGPAVAATSRAVLIDPLRPKLLGWWIASLLGPRLALPLGRAMRRIRGEPDRDGLERRVTPA